MSSKKSVRIVFEGDDYYLYTLTSWLEYVRDLIRDLTCVKEIQVETRQSDYVRIYLDGELIFEGLPDNEGVLAEILVHELKRRGFTCGEETSEG